MKKSTFLKTCAVVCLFFLFSGLLKAQLTVVTSSGLPNIGRGQIKFADFNNDGKLDALIVGQTTAYDTNGGTFGLYLGNGDGTFTDATSSWFGTTPTVVSAGMVGIADYNNDGYLDFAYTGFTSSGKVFYLYKNNGTSFTDVTSSAFSTAPTGCYEGSLEWGDIDNDGDLDLLIQGRSYTALPYPTSSSYRVATTQLYKNNGDGTFTSATINATSVCYGQALFVDLDNDGDLDIYYSGGGNVGGYMLNDGTGTFGALTSNNATRGSNVVIGDFNGDGTADLLQSYTNTSSTPAPAFRILKNTSTTSTITLTSTALSANYGVGGTSTTTNTGMLSCVDYNADGFLDFTIQGAASATTPTTSLFLNEGTATFTDAGLSLTGLHYGGAIWADLNNDNKPDLITFGYTDATASTAQTIVYLNGTTTANAAPSAPTTITASTSSVAVLSWTMPDNADDHTPNVDLTYNVRIGTTSGASNIMKANISGRPGKYHLTSTTVKSLANGQYYWSVQAVDGANIAGAWATEGTFTIGSNTAAPTVQASNIASTSVSQTSLTLNWTNGDGYKTAVFVKQGTSTSDLASPVANTAYTANTIFGSGSQIGSTSWYCVYNGSITPNTSSSVDISGLTALTSYQVMAVSYNGSSDNSTINYLLTAGTNNPAIITSADYTVPTIITSALTVSDNTTGTSVIITPSQSGTNYNQNYPTVVFMKVGSSTIDTVKMVANTTYTGDLSFGSGSQVGTSGWYCVYNGNSSYMGSGSFNAFSAFTNLTPNTSYQVMACTYNGTAGLEKYSTPAGVVFSTPTLSGITEANSSKLKIYPILSKGKISIEGQGISSVSLINITGQVLSMVKPSTNASTLNLDSLADGIYIVNVYFADGSVKAQRIVLKK